LTSAPGFAPDIGGLTPSFPRESSDEMGLFDGHCGSAICRTDDR
jgi:hypothetical protein